MSGPGLIGGGAAAGYGYPMANGLLAAMSAPQAAATNWTNVALNLAGDPHAGAYAASDGALPSGFSATSAPVGTSGSSSPSGGTQILGSVIGALSKDPSLLKNGVSAIQSLFGGVPTGMAGTAPGGAGLASGLTAAQQADLSSAFTGAPVAGSLADSMGLTAGSLSPLAASALAPVGTGAITAAGNAAGASAASELASALGTAPAAAPAAAAPAAAAPAASGAGSASLGALAADAGVLAAMGYAAHGAMTMPTNNGWSIGDISQLGKNVANATNAGTISPGTAGLTAPAGSLNAMNPNGTVNTGLIGSLQSLNQLELGNFGGASGYAQGLLNDAGYQSINQAMKGKTWAGGGTPAASGLASNLLRKRY